MEIEEIMTRNPVCIDVAETVGGALERLREKDIRHLPVLENGALVGIISERDLHSVSVLAASGEGRALMEAKVSKFMSSGVVTVAPGDDVAEVTDIFIEGRFGALPVVDAHDGKVVGIVSYIDILTALRGLL